jgi:hypothetical protein
MQPGSKARGGSRKICGCERKEFKSGFAGDHRSMGPLAWVEEKPDPKKTKA